MKILTLVAFAVLLLNSHGTITTHASSKMPAKLYKQVKGKWYTQWSSAGYDVKFTKTRVKYYKHGAKKPSYKYPITKVKKVKKGTHKGEYRIVYKLGRKKYASFIGTAKKGFAFYGCASGYKHYSGSSSLDLGRWK